MHKLGLDMQSVFGMPPLQHVELAADLGCELISTALGPMPWNPCGFPAWSLRQDAGLRREMKAAMRDAGVSISAGEGYVVRPNVEVRDYAADLDLIAELGAASASTVSMEPDRARALDQLAMLADLTAERGLRLNLEFAPPHPINTLPSALAAIRHIQRPNVRLVLDAMHVFRSGATVADLAAIEPGLIGHAQLCDAPRQPPHDDYMREACFERLSPGDGELPLRDFIAVLPRDLPIGLEIPMLAEVEAGKDLRTVLKRSVQAARDLFARSEAGRA